MRCHERQLKKNKNNQKNKKKGNSTQMSLAPKNVWAFEFAPTTNQEILAVDSLLSKL